MRPMTTVVVAILLLLFVGFRLGTFELSYKPEIPYRVVINEAVELAKVFGAEQGHKYVNGVLDQVAKNVRSVEIQAKQGR